MFCRKCGHKLEDGDKFCSSCGAKTILAEDANTEESLNGNTVAPDSESEAPPLFEPFDFSSLDIGFDLGLKKEEQESEADKKTTVSPVEDFDWNIHSFPGMKPEKTEDIDFDWSMPAEEEPALQMEETGDASAVSEAAVPELELQEAAGSSETADEGQSSLENSEVPASPLEESLFGELDSKTDEARKQSEEIDKFFTFHKKNEQFQKLLDQEYEKIKSGNILSDEMDTAAAVSEEKFASRKPEDPMEDLFEAEGVVKAYEPKPIETDVLERIEAAEAEKKAREESERLIEEEKEKARQAEEARIKAEEEARAAEEAARRRLDEEAKRAADARAAEEAAERERARAAAREEARAALKTAEEEAEKARLEAEAKLEEQTAKLKAEAEERARKEAEARAEKEAREKAEEEARIKAEEEARQKAEEEARIRAEEAAAQAAVAAEVKPEERDPQNHISEMVRARETFFGQEAVIEAEEGKPEKTKAVDKAAILAGMATASEMVQRDRAYAAQQAAKEAAEAEALMEDETQEPGLEIPEIFEHLEEAEEPASEEETEQMPEAADLFAQLQEEEPVESVADETEQVEEEPSEVFSAEEEPAELFSIEDLLGAEEPEEPKEPAAEEPEVIQLEDFVFAEEEAPAAEVQVAEPSEAETVQEPVAAEEVQEEISVQQPEEGAQTEAEESSAAAVVPEEDKPLFADDFEDDEDEEERGGKGRIVLKVFLVILIILLVMEIAGVAIKVVAPTSGAAKFIDSQLNKVIHLFTGDDAEYSVIAATEDIRQEPAEDKSGLIKAEMGKNKDGNIGEIQYNADLKFDPDKEYENKDINMTQSLADVTWYKSADNKQVYYDQAIVGTIIAFESQKMNLINYKDSSVLNLVKEDTDFYKTVKELKGSDKAQLAVLQIGEIRQAGSSYFVWVSEEMGNEGASQNTEKKIYEMTPDGETMKLTACYDI